MEEEKSISANGPQTHNPKVRPTPLSFVPLALVFCLGANEAVCYWVYQDQSNVLEEQNYSWTGATATIIRIGGSLFAITLMECYNRKMTFQLEITLLIIGMTCISVYFSWAPYIIVFSVGDLISKFATGMEVVVLVYIAETNNPRTRSVFLSLILVMMMLSYYLSFLLSSHNYTVQRSLYVVIAIAIVSFILNLFNPDSPESSDRESKMKVRASVPFRRTKNVDPELGENSTSIEATLRELDKDRVSPWVIYVYSFLSVGIFSWFSSSLIACCAAMIGYYKEKLNLTPYNKTLEYTSATTLLGASIIACVAVNSLNQKRLVKICGFCITSLSTIAGIYEFLSDEVETKPTRIHQLPIMCVWVCSAFATIGLWTVSILMIGEMTLLRRRGLQTGLLWVIVMIQVYSANWLFTKAIERQIRLYFLFMGMVFTGIKVFLFAYSNLMIDTRDKSLEEIDNMIRVSAAKVFNRYWKN